MGCINCSHLLLGVKGQQQTEPECLMDMNRECTGPGFYLMIDLYINAVRSRKKLQQRADLC